MATGIDTTPIYFWKENEEYGFLCQWHPVKFNAPAYPSSKVQKSMVFSSAEQYMMYNKAMTFHDLDTATQIMNLSDPQRQKAKGRQVKGFDEKVWKEAREKIVETGNWWKFTAAEDETEGQALKGLLLKTGDRLLVEVCLGLKVSSKSEIDALILKASAYDNIWGIGFNAINAELNRAHWGLNLLGKALMKVRDRIGEEYERAKE